jgi:hypothetical protein
VWAWVGPVRSMLCSDSASMIWDVVDFLNALHCTLHILLKVGVRDSTKSHSRKTHSQKLTPENLLPNIRPRETRSYENSLPKTHS